ncbi:hypothetical protein T01_11183 [Trichinella spiralis]|uniref:Uncharacterized protein n=1 Tax=Trichinella spiralis TaxID=6334 RepID=A0A0V1AR07_TRISP|nr:hypothetical protein T01_12308 [Trichinella spiralis]KRY26577.1 hypothetical protein T01_4354 [Trichinella spiralis]KRY26732.1 hypothetical protein T01_11183 [Trichinella spiralis]
MQPVDISYTNTRSALRCFIALLIKNCTWSIVLICHFGDSASVRRITLYFLGSIKHKLHEFAYYLGITVSWPRSTRAGRSSATLCTGHFERLTLDAYRDYQALPFVQLQLALKQFN